MSKSGRELLAVSLAWVLLCAALVVGFGVTNAAAVSGNTVSNSAGNASISTLQTAGNQVADYTVTAKYPTVKPGNDTIRLNFSGSGADFTHWPATVKNKQVQVSTQSDAIGVSSVTPGNGMLNLSLNKAIPGGEKVDVTFTVNGVKNPGTTGDRNFTVDLRSGGTTTTRAGGTITIVEGGDISGTVTDADSGSPVGDSSVSVKVVEPSSGKTVARYGNNPTTGDYLATVPAGTYDINVTADGYARSSTSATVTDGGQTTADVALDTGGWVNGTVTDGTGSPVSNLKVSAIREGSGDFAADTKTAADGSYSLALDPDTSSYQIYAGGKRDYKFDLAKGVGVTKDATTTVNLTTPEKPGDGTLSLTVEGPDGNAVSGATVYARSADFAYGGVTQTSKNGIATFTKPAGNYTLRVETAGYGTKTLRSVPVAESETTSRTVSLSTPAYVNGTVTDTDGSPVGKGKQVLVSNGNQFYPTKTDSNGEFNVTVGAGDYSVSVFMPGKTAPAKSVSVAAGDVGTADLKLQTATIKHSDVSIVSGPGDGSNLGVRTDLQSGLMKLQLVDESSYSGSGVGKPDNLTSLGVTDTTEFEINLTVTNFDPNSLIWGVRNADWETSPNESVTDGTDITITGSTVNMQAVNSKRVGPLLFKSPSQVSWPSGEAATADVGFTRTVYFGLFDLSTIPGAAAQNLNGISTTTNAQRFAPPTYENDTLRVWMAAPSTTVGGADHTGFYQATIPDSQLDEWGVDDPETELQVSYKDKPRSFSVTETDGGARIRLEDISYSASYAEISPDEAAIQANDKSEGSSSGSTGSFSGNPTTVPPEAVQTAAISDGRGGSGATVLSVADGQTVSVEFADAVVGSPDVTGEGTTAANSSVTMVNVTAGTDLSELSVSVTPTNESEAGVPAVTAESTTVALGYVDISTNAGDESVSAAAVTIDLSERARESAGLTRENVTVYRYHDGWQALETTPVGNGSYRAESPGFSVFAIGGPQASPPAPAAQSTQTATQTSTPGESTADSGTDSETASTVSPGTATTGGSGPGFGAVTGLLALVAAALLARRT